MIRSGNPYDLPLVILVFIGVIIKIDKKARKPGFLSNLPISEERKEAPSVETSSPVINDKDGGDVEVSSSYYVRRTKSVKWKRPPSLFGDHNLQLEEWNRIYNSLRSYQSLDYLTPYQYY